jgi:uncharacterized protein
VQREAVQTSTQRKPVDLGNGRIVASFGIDGSLLSVSAPHPDTGLVELVGGPAFPPERDGDVDAVRRHRAGLTDPTHAVLRIVDGVGHLTSQRPSWQVTGPTWDASVVAWATPGRPTVEQRLRLRRRAPGRVRLALAGRLDRPPCAEITPGGPMPPALTTSRLVAHGPAVELTTAAPDPSAAMVVAVDIAGGPDVRWVEQSESTATLDLPGSDELEVVVTITMGPARAEVARLSHGDRATWPAASHGWDRRATSARGRPGDVLDRIAAGAVRYVRGCTALNVGPDHCCLVTDHRLLPLSWTRDSYYQAALLLATGDPDAVEVVRRHLHWLSGPGRDDAGVWRRSHYATGAVKDTAYQADQQLYPLLELADYRRVTGGWPTIPSEDATHDGANATRWGELVRRVWHGLPRDAGELIRGEENPADDRATHPYLLSSQLLLAHVARRLAEWEHELAVDDLGLEADADRTLATLRTAFACDGPVGRQWAYESDGADGRRVYHDANDVPTALAPLWGLCDAADPVWRATMRFAWSPDNPGFVPGRYGGLGSHHTPGVWPLGDAQEWTVAQLIGNDATAARVLAKWDLMASDDGMLPEAYDPSTGEWTARHWFAWPGALVGLLHRTLHDRTGPWLTP